MRKKRIKNFEIWIRQMREKYGIPMKILCEGLCARQELARLEEGDWEPGYFLQEALLARLGIEAETYEYFLDYPDSEHLDRRMEILENVLWNRLDRAEELLENYRLAYAAGRCGEEVENYAAVQDSMEEQNYAVGRASVEKRLAMQFYLDMLGQIRRRTASQEELYEIFDRAVRQTVPGAWEKPLEEQVLSVNELNLMLETERYRKGGARPEYLLKLMEYIEKRPFDGRGKAKIYPKAVYFYFLCREEKRMSVVESCQSEKTGIREDKKLWEYCERSMDMLRDNGRMYYLWEILDMRERLLGRRMERLIQQGSWMAADMEKMLEENQRWKGVLEQVYATWHVSRETSDNCYIHAPKAVSCVNEVIRIRRRMLGISLRDLSQGICSTDTLRRLEKRKSCGQREITWELFRRLGLSGEFTRPELVTSSLEALELLERLREKVNKCYWDEAETILLRIQEIVDMEEPSNRQTVLSISAVIRWKRKEIDNTEYCRLQREALEITMPFEAFLRQGEKYLTHHEQTCIQNMMQGMDRESRDFLDCMRAFEELYKPHMDKGVTAITDGMYALIMGLVGSEYGNMGDYDKSDLYNAPIIQGYLRFRKLNRIPHALYACWWNYAERKKMGIPDDRNLDDVEEVTKCLVLCEIIRDRSKVLFCEKVLKRLKGKKMS